MSTAGANMSTQWSPNLSMSTPHSSHFHLSTDANMPVQSSSNHPVNTMQSGYFALPSMPPSSKIDMTGPPQAGSSREKMVPGGTALPAKPLERTHFQFALPSDTRDGSPHKRVKKVMTTASASISEEVETLRSHRTLELARASREAFAAGVRYHRLRLREIEMMRIMATDEYEEAEALLKAADRQIGEIRHILNCEGRGALNTSINMFPRNDKNSEDTDCYSGADSAEFASPTPSGSDDT